MQEKRLKELLIDAHATCARRPCSSSTILVEAFHANGRNTFGAIAAAISSLGGPHAPIEEAYRFLRLGIEMGRRDMARHVIQILNEGCRVPGWGCAFVKGHPDPIWAKLRGHLLTSCTGQDALKTMEVVTSTLAVNGRPIQPNAAAYTALVAQFLGYSAETAALLLLECRLPEWGRMLEEINGPEPATKFMSR